MGICDGVRPWSRPELDRSTPGAVDLSSGQVDIFVQLYDTTIIHRGCYVRKARACGRSEAEGCFFFFMFPFVAGISI
jgi:hypothetical protein